MDRGLFRRNVLIGLHALGLGLAVYLTWAYYLNYYLVEGNILLCTLGKVFDCYAVLMSRWAELVPGWPVSSVAVFYFTLQLLWTATEGPGLVRGRHDVPFVLNAAACLVGMVLFCAMIFSVKSLCIFCLSIDATLWSTLLLRWRWRSQDDPRGLRLSPGRLVLLGAGGAAALLVPELLATAHARGMIHRDVASILAQEPDPEFPRSESGPLTLVVFLDFGCPICRKGSQTLEALRLRHPGEIRMDVRNFPINPSCNPTVPESNRSPEHRWSCEAARIALSAQEAGRLQEAYASLYGHQEDLAGEVARWSRDPAIASDLASGRPDRALARDVQLGIKVKLQGVPEYYFEGLLVDGPRHLEEWEALLAGLKAARGAPVLAAPPG